MKEYKTLKKTRDSRYIYKTELDKACFRHSMAHGDFKDLARRTASDKVLIDKVFNIFKNPKYDGYQRDLVSMVYNFFDKKSSSSGIKPTPNQQLVGELHKPIIKKFRRRKVYSLFKDNIWVADLADMQLISKYNKRIRFLLCVIDNFSKAAWVIPLKGKKVIAIVNAFQNVLNDSKRKPSKI